MTAHSRIALLLVGMLAALGLSRCRDESCGDRTTLRVEIAVDDAALRPVIDAIDLQITIAGETRAQSFDATGLFADGESSLLVDFGDRVLSGEALGLLVQLHTSDGDSRQYEETFEWTEGRCEHVRITVPSDAPGGDAGVPVDACDDEFLVGAVFDFDESIADRSGELASEWVGAAPTYEANPRTACGEQLVFANSASVQGALRIPHHPTLAVARGTMRFWLEIDGRRNRAQTIWSKSSAGNRGSELQISCEGFLVLRVDDQYVCSADPLPINTPQSIALSLGATPALSGLGGFRTDGAAIGLGGANCTDTVPCSLVPWRWDAHLADLVIGASAVAGTALADLHAPLRGARLDHFRLPTP